MTTETCLYRRAVGRLNRAEGLCMRWRRHFCLRFGRQECGRQECLPHPSENSTCGNPPIAVKAPLLPTRIASALVLAALLAAAACSEKKSGPPPPVTVTVAEAVKKDVPLVLAAIGTVQAYDTVSIKALVGGQIMRVHVQDGQDVRKGDLLFTIDPRPFQAALDMAQARLARDKAHHVHPLSPQLRRLCRHLHGH